MNAQVQNVKIDDAKNIITDALFGTVNAEDSIIRLSELLFPGENLLEKVRLQKIISDVNSILKPSVDKELLNIGKIERDDELEALIVHVSFSNINDFIQLSQKIIAQFSNISKKYGITMKADFHVSQIIE